jgi:hypothetical protein
VLLGRDDIALKVHANVDDPLTRLVFFEIGIIDDDVLIGVTAKKLIGGS